MDLESNNILYRVKKGPADAFRGDWYVDEKSFTTLDEAIAHAAKLTLENFLLFDKSWEEFGYEWSVFEKNETIETKRWEGFKYISFVRCGNRGIASGFI